MVYLRSEGVIPYPVNRQLIRPTATLSCQPSCSLNNLGMLVPPLSPKLTALYALRVATSAPVSGEGKQVD